MHGDNYYVLNTEQDVAMYVMYCIHVLYVKDRSRLKVRGNAPFCI